MYRHLIDLVEHLGHPRIGVVGDLMLDQYVYGDAERISPEAPIQVLKVASKVEQFGLGGAGSVANNLRTLGAEVAVFGVCGGWPAGRGEQLKGRLEQAGVDIRGIDTLGDRATTLKVRFVGRAQRHILQQVLRVDWEDTTPIPPACERRLLARIRKRLPGCGAVVISDYEKGVVTETICRETITQARKLGIPVLVDPHPSANYAKYKGATVCTPNRYETELATHIHLTDEASLNRAARRLQKGLDLAAVHITLDKEGAYLLEKGRPGQLVPARPRQVYDNAGAGDMVVAVMALVIAAGRPLPDAARLANVAGGLEVEKFGVQPVTREEMIADLLGEARRGGDKVCTAENLMLDLGRHRGLSQTVVFTNGCFDVLHAGHIAFLEAASRQGDVLVVGLNTDRSVRAIKGPGRPVCSQEERARVLAALEVVDYIALFDGETPQKLIEAIRPDVLVKGEDWRAKGVVGREFVESHGGRVVLLPLVKGISTTQLVERIRNGTAAAPSRSSPACGGRSRRKGGRP